MAYKALDETANVYYCRNVRIHKYLKNSPRRIVLRNTWLYFILFIYLFSFIYIFTDTSLYYLLFIIHIYLFIWDIGFLPQRLVTLSSSVVTICTTCFNHWKLWAVQYIYFFRILHTIISRIFPMQINKLSFHWWRCCLKQRNWILCILFRRTPGFKMLIWRN
jgi:hypothetical protein